MAGPSMTPRSGPIRAGRGARSRVADGPSAWPVSLGLVELDVLAARIVSRLHQDAASELVNVTTLDDDGELVVRATLGNRTDHMIGMRFPVAAGIGGLAVAKRRTIRVPDYARIAATYPFRDVMVGGEGIRAAAAVPLIVNSQALGLLFLGRRDDEPIEDGHLRRLQDMAKAVAPLVGASMQLVHHLDTAIAEERLRIASRMHDEIIPLLFFIGATARRARDTLPVNAGEVAELIDSIEEMASSANGLARGALTSLGSLSKQQLLSIRIRATSDKFIALTGIPVSVGIQGTPLVLESAIIDTLDAVVAEALNNVAKHAETASVVVTLIHSHNEVSITVMDDGVGLPTGFELKAITDAAIAGHYGLASLAHRIQLLRGRLGVETNEDGGVTVRASVPMSRS